VLRGGHQARGRSLGLDCRKGRRLAPGVGFEAGAAERVVSSRRKTSRAVITRTIIDGSTVDMRESPGVFYGKLATGWTGKATSRASAEPIVLLLRAPAAIALVLRSRRDEWIIALPGCFNLPCAKGAPSSRNDRLRISSKLRQSLARRINQW
jgi:hypothetical protein